jgi:hypothetical protein
MLLTGPQVAEHAYDLRIGLEGRKKEVREFDAVTAIGDAAVLAINLRSLPEISFEKLRLVSGYLFGIDPPALREALRLLSDLDLVELDEQRRAITKVIPLIGKFDDVFEKVGEYAGASSLTELEQMVLTLLKELSESPRRNQELLTLLGDERQGYQKTVEIGTQTGLVSSIRARGQEILISPVYFSGNLAALADAAAKGGATTMTKVLTLVAQAQGVPLSIIKAQGEIAGTRLAPREVALVERLASEGILKPPAIESGRHGRQQFIFTPEPGNARLSVSNREVYERALALAAAVRKGQMLPEQYRIRYPDALLAALENRGYVGASSEAVPQYRPLQLLGLGRLEHVRGDRYRFRLGEGEDNVRAARTARQLLSGGSAVELRADRDARHLLLESTEHVRSIVEAANLREKRETVMLDETHEQLELTLYNL